MCLILCAARSRLIHSNHRWLVCRGVRHESEQAVDESCIELNSYFRKRDRVGGTRLGKALLGLYSEHGTTARVLMDGMAVAVDTHATIKALLGQEPQLTGPRFATVERALLLTDEIDPVWLGEEPGEVTKLTVYSQGGDRVFQVPAFEVACELLHRRGIARATALSGGDGTVRGGLRDRFLRQRAGARFVVVAVDTGDRIAMVLPEVASLFRNPIMTMTKARLCKRDGRLLSHPLGTSHAAGGEVQLKLAVYARGTARQGGQSVHRAMARELRAAGIGGSVTQRGIWGFEGHDAPGRHGPAITTVVGDPDQIAVAFDIIDPLTAACGLVTVATVTTALLDDDGRAASPVSLLARGVECFPRGSLGEPTGVDEMPLMGAAGDGVHSVVGGDVELKAPTIDRGQFDAPGDDQAGRGRGLVRNRDVGADTLLGGPVEMWNQQLNTGPFEKADKKPGREDFGHRGELRRLGEEVRNGTRLRNSVPQLVAKSRREGWLSHSRILPREPCSVTLLMYGTTLVVALPKVVRMMCRTGDALGASINHD